MYRIENAPKFCRYSATRDDLPLKYQVAKANPKAVQAACFDKLMEDNAFSADINETYLFRGTMSESVESICCLGIDNRVGTNKGKMLRHGSYFAEKASKADQYCGAAPKGRARRSADSDIALHAGMPLCMSACSACSYACTACQAHSTTLSPVSV